MHNEGVSKFLSSSKNPEICVFNNTAQPLKSGLRSSLKVRLRCAYYPIIIDKSMLSFFFLIYN